VSAGPVLDGNGSLEGTIPVRASSKAAKDREGNGAAEDPGAQSLHFWNRVVEKGGLLDWLAMSCSGGNGF
jgi:hypothetical protein